MTVKLIQYSKGVVLETVVKELDFDGVKSTMEKLGLEIDEVQISCLFRGCDDEN